MIAVRAAVSGFGRSAKGALRPGPNPFAFAAAGRTVVPAALLAVVGASVGDLSAVGLAYLGAACAAAFVTGNVHRARLSALLAQSVGAAIGISLGVLLPSSPAVLVCTAAVAGVISGVVGAIGPSAPGFGMMLCIGVAFGQFGGSPLPWWQQTIGYLVGTALVSVAVLSPWLFRRRAVECQLVADVFAASADLCAAIGTAGARPARMRLATAAAASAGADHPRTELVKFAAATLYGEGTRVAGDAVAAIRTAGEQVRAGGPVSVPITFDRSTPGLAALAVGLGPDAAIPDRESTRGHSLRSVMQSVASPTALANGARIGLCAGVATAITVAMHEPNHAFWLPLTVAVIVRPEYASVFVRTVNRICGSLAGALFAAAVLLFYPSGIAVAAAAALTVSFAVLSAPKLYALAVTGITATALLSGSIAAADPVLPGLRLLDTVIGAAVALVFGYLMWPGARRLPSAARMDTALGAADLYLAEAVLSPGQRSRFTIRRTDAYRLAHLVRAAGEAAMLEPPPVSSVAVQLIPMTIELEEVLDLVTAAASAVDSGATPDALAGEAAQRLASIRQRSTALTAPRAARPNWPRVFNRAP